MENPIEKIKEELFKNLVSFLNEIEISFDYIDDDVILKIKNYITDIKSNDEMFTNFINFTYNHLHNFEKEISFILFSNQKFKKEKLNFLNDIFLYGDTIDNCFLKFKIFENENKNTKRSFIKYIYNIYLTTYFINNHKHLSNSDENILTDELNNFISKIVEESKGKENTKNNKKKHSRTHAIDFNNMNNSPLGGMEQMMSSLMGNKDILNIATDISNQMKNENINPMSMLSGLMTGKMDKNLENLVGKIQEKVETKINTGEINKEVFEEQAKNIINTVNNVDFKDLGIPSLNVAMNNLMKDFNNDELK